MNRNRVEQPKIADSQPSNFNPLILMRGAFLSLATVGSLATAQSAHAQNYSIYGEEPTRVERPREDFIIKNYRSTPIGKQVTMGVNQYGEHNLEGFNGHTIGTSRITMSRAGESKFIVHIYGSTNHRIGRTQVRIGGQVINIPETEVNRQKRGNYRLRVIVDLQQYRRMRNGQEYFSVPAIEPIFDFPHLYDIRKNPTTIINP